MEMTSAWWTSRSIMAAATTSSPKTSPQRPKGLLLVTISDAEHPVVIGQVPGLHRCRDRRHRGAAVRLTELVGGGAVGRVGDRLMPGPAAIMAGQRPSGAGDHHLGHVGVYLDAAADHRWVHQ
jgi:hypothetical protein